MRFLGGEAPGSRALGSRTLHVALMALFAVLISAFMLYATVAWAQTAEEADAAEGAEAAQSEGQPDEDASSSEANDEGSEDEGADEQGSEDDGKPDDEASEDDEEIRLEGKPAGDEDSEQVMKTPEEAAEDEMAEKISEAEDIEALANGELAGEVAFAQDRDGDGEADRIVIPRGDCVVRQGASVTLREDAQYGGARYTLTDNRNVQITSNNRRIQIVSDSRTNNDVRSDNGRTLDPGAYDVISSRGIICTDDDNGPRNPPIIDRDPRVGVIFIIERTGALPDTGGEAGGDTLTTAANGERASTPASVLFSVLSIVGFTGLLFLRRMRAR